ncbi:MAG: glycosyltransferase [Kiritimatiellae bacterium]|nr:glycosyltransferase [Kiritimatiellia bacterium]
MHVLIVAADFDRSEQALFLGLANKGIDVTLVCRPDAARLQEFKDTPIRILPRAVRHRVDLGSIRFLRKLLQDHSVNIVYAVINKTLSVSLLATVGLRIPVVGYRGTIGHINRFDPACWLTYLNPRLKGIVCVSEAVRQYLLGFGLPPPRLVTIYKGHDPDWYRFESRPSLAEFGFTDAHFVVAFSGCIRPVKGVDVLLDAVSMLPTDTPIRILLIGELLDKRVIARLRDPAIQRVVHHAGYRSDAAQIVGACHAYVMPSVAREGLPRGVIEAMSQKVPPIVTHAGGMPELVVHNQSGLVVPARDSEALRDAMLTLSHNREQALTYGQAAAQRIHDIFNIRTTISKTAALFTKLSRSPSGR